VGQKCLSPLEPPGNVGVFLCVLYAFVTCHVPGKCWPFWNNCWCCSRPTWFGGLRWCLVDTGKWAKPGARHPRTKAPKGAKGAKDQGPSPKCQNQSQAGPGCLVLLVKLPKIANVNRAGQEHEGRQRQHQHQHQQQQHDSQFPISFLPQLPLSFTHCAMWLITFESQVISVITKALHMSQDNSSINSSNSNISNKQQRKPKKEQQEVAEDTQKEQRKGEETVGQNENIKIKYKI